MSHILELAPPPPDERIHYGEDTHQFGHLRLPETDPPYPVVVVIHGGFWRARYDLEHTGHLAAALTKRGVATWSVEYRRIGHPGGGWPGTFTDVAAATDSLRDLAPAYGLDLARVVTMGHSAGGHLALWLAARSRIPPGSPLREVDPFIPGAVVALAGVADLEMGWRLKLGNGVVETLMGGSPESASERYHAGSPAALLPLGVSQRLIHGTADPDVPFVVSEVYRDAAVTQGDDAELVALPGAGHFELIDPRSGEWTVVEETVLGCLR